MHSLEHPTDNTTRHEVTGHTDNPIEQAVEIYSSHQAPSPSSDTQNPQASLDTAHPDEALIQKDNIQPTASYSLIVEEYIGERDEEASSQQQLSAENQARLRDIILLNKDITTLVQDADQIRDINNNNNIAFCPKQVGVG